MSKDQEFQKIIDERIKDSPERKEELRSYYDSQEISNAILDIMNLYSDEMINTDGTLKKQAILRLVLDAKNLENPIGWSEERKQYLGKNPESIIDTHTLYIDRDGRKMGLYPTALYSAFDKMVIKATNTVPYIENKYKRVRKVREIAESFIDQANDQIESGGRVSDSFVSDFLKSYEPTSDSGSDDGSKKSDPSDAFGSSDDEDASTPSGGDRALSALEESLFRTASEANDIVDRLKELYNEVYDGRGISTAQERAEPGWKPSYLDRQFDLRVMDIEEQSKSRNRALILTMAGIDLRGEMEEARKLISFKTKELRDIGHDPDGFRRTQYQKQSQFLLQSFGLLMQIAPNAFGAMYGISQNAWALSNDIGRRQITNLGNQYAGGTPMSLAVSADESGVE